MAAEYEDVDIHGLFMLAELLDRFWVNPSTKLAAEIRQHRLCFGLSPADRQRLQWQIDRVEAAGKRRTTPAGKRADPRLLLLQRSDRSGGRR